MDDMINAIEQVESIKTIEIDPQLLDNRKKTHKNEKSSSSKTKIPKKRVVTQQKQWLQHIQSDSETIFSNESYKWFFQRKSHIDSDPKITILLREIHRKIEGYKRQDIEKNKYDPIRFVDYAYVEQMLSQTLECFYCKEPVKLLYEMSRDPKQWTLERLDNNQGHNKGNVQISCLNCNLRRRTMYHEKYKFTKQMRLVKDDSQVQCI